MPEQVTIFEMGPHDGLQNEARASVLGTGAGLAVLAAALLLHRTGRLPRRGLPIGVALGSQQLGEAAPLG